MSSPVVLDNFQRFIKEQLELVGKTVLESLPPMVESQLDNLYYILCDKACINAKSEDAKIAWKAIMITFFKEKTVFDDDGFIDELLWNRLRKSLSKILCCVLINTFSSRSIEEVKANNIVDRDSYRDALQNAISTLRNTLEAFQLLEESIDNTEN